DGSVEAAGDEQLPIRAESNRVDPTGRRLEAKAFLPIADVPDPNIAIGATRGDQIPGGMKRHAISFLSVHCEHADDARRRLSKIPDADRSVLASRRELGVVRPERDAEHASRVPTQNVQCRFASRPGAGAGRGVPDSDRTILPGRREPGTVIAESHVRRPAFMTQE